jgi:hypothetical protein
MDKNATSVWFSPSTKVQIQRLLEKLPWMSKNAAILEHAVHELWKHGESAWQELNKSLPKAAYGAKKGQAGRTQSIRLSEMTSERIEKIRDILGEKRTRVLELAIYHFAQREKIAV